LFCVRSTNNGTTAAFDDTITFIYFSMAIQTSAGYGDIVANSFYVEWAVALQMLLGMLYNVVIITQVETLYVPKAETAEDEEFKVKNRPAANGASTNPYAALGAGGDPESSSSSNSAGMSV
jgi:hypothetical protein